MQKFNNKIFKYILLLIVCLFPSLILAKDNSITCYYGTAKMYGKKNYSLLLQYDVSMDKETCEVKVDVKEKKFSDEDKKTIINDNSISPSYFSSFNKSKATLSCPDTLYAHPDNEVATKLVLLNVSTESKSELDMEMPLMKTKTHMSSSSINPKCNLTYVKSCEYDVSNDAGGELKIVVNVFKEKLKFDLPSGYTKNNYPDADKNLTEGDINVFSGSKCPKLDVSCTLDNKICVIGSDKEKKNYASNTETVGTLVKTSGCGIFGENTLSFIKKIYKFLQFIIPVIVIIFGMLDFIKALGSGEEKEFKKAGSNFAKRVIIGVCFFLIPAILSLFIRISGITSQYDINDGVKSIFCILE